MKELISVLLPAYNVGEYIGICLDSILQQTYSNYEVIIVNDGSTDDTLAICQAYAQRDSRIHLFSQENAGVSSARNHCLSQAKGEFVAFIDPDDYVKKDYLQTLLNMQHKTSADIIACDYNTQNGPENQDSERHRFSNKLLNNDEALRAINCFDSFKVYMWAKLIRRTLFNGLSFPSVDIAEDQYVCCELLSKAKGVYYQPTALYTYRMRSGSICQNVGRHTKTPIYAVQEQTKYIQAHHPEITSYAYAYLFFSGITYYNNYIINNESITKEEERFINSIVQRKLKYVLRDPDNTQAKKMQALIFSISKPLYNQMLKLKHTS